MEEITGKPLPVRTMDRRAGDPPNLTAAADLIRKHLDWTPRYDDLRAIIETALAWERRIAATAAGKPVR